MEWEPRTHPSVEAAVNICDWNETMHYVDDALGSVLLFVFSRPVRRRLRIPHLQYPNIHQFSYRNDMDADDLWQVARINRNLVRSINISRGLKKVMRSRLKTTGKKRA